MLQILPRAPGGEATSEWYCIANVVLSGVQVDLPSLSNDAQVRKKGKRRSCSQGAKGDGKASSGRERDGGSGAGDEAGERGLHTLVQRVALVAADAPFYHLLLVRLDCR